MSCDLSLIFDFGSATTPSPQITILRLVSGNAAELCAIVVSILIMASNARRLLIISCLTRNARRRRRAHLGVFTSLVLRNRVRRTKIFRSSRFWETEVPKWTEKKFRANFRVRIMAQQFSISIIVRCSNNVASVSDEFNVLIH